MARKSAAMDGNFAASSWTLPVSNVGGYHPRPLGARAKEPAAPPHQPRGMKRVAGDEELQLFPAAQVRADDALGRAVAVQQQDLERIAEIVVVELIVADAVEPHRAS